MDDISKLPKWAQQTIRELSRERDTAINKLNEYLDSETETEIYVDDLVSTGEQQGPTFKRRYIQGHVITFNHSGVQLDVNIFYDGCIDLKWSIPTDRIGDVAFIPQSYQNARLVSKKDMR